MLWFIVFCSLMIVVNVILMATTRSSRRMHSSRPSENTDSLSIEQAQARVEKIIAQENKILVKHANARTHELNQLGQVTREFFSRYSELRINGGFCLLMKDIKPSDYMHGYLSIGHSEDWDIVQRPGDDEVFIVEGSETSEDEMDVRFPSVYHLILDACEAR